MMRLRHILPVIGAAAALAGCKDEVIEEEQVRVSLERATSCEDLEGRLKADALAKMNRQIDAQIRDVKFGYRGYDDSLGEDGSSNASTGSGAGAGAGSPEDSGNAEPPDHSDTNTQVEGVDEADIVKTDGTYLYLLHGHELEIVSAYPASDMQLAGSSVIEGSPTEMFLAEGKLVVFSSVDGTAIYEQAGLESPYAGVGYDDCYDCYGFPTLTKVTVLAVSGTEVAVERELYFEGSYNSSRRVDAKVRLVLSGGNHEPALEFWPSGDYYYGNRSDQDLIQEFERLRGENMLKIWQADLEDLIPRRFVRLGEEVHVLEPSCDDYYVPTPGSTAYGMTQIQSFDILDEGAGVAETQIVGHVQTVYANEGAMYLVGQSWNDPWLLTPDWDVPISTSSSHIHKFDISGQAPVYEGTGSVPGWVHNQFSLDERDGKLRITTTDERSSMTEWVTENNLFVLADAGATLEIVGSLRGLAKDETIQSTRFIEDTAFVVTFRQIDPLFAIDVSDATNPRLLGELHIPGFSEYMHPLGGKHLLTIGRDGTLDGQVTGAALQIFDVTDPVSPQLAHKHSLGEGYSEAEYNHKAFTLYNGILAIPMERYDYNSENYFMSSQLELFSIDTEEGISPIGAVDHTALFDNMPQDYCYWYGYGVRRGVFIEDMIYSISEGGVIASEVADPATALATVPLPATNGDCYYGE